MRSFDSVRAVLFTPGNRPDRFQKAEQSGADALMIDLEDGVSFAEKKHAREQVISYFKQIKPLKGFLRCIRINSLKTIEGLQDVLALIEHNIQPDALCVPKIEYPAELILLDSYFSALKIPYFVFIESALGLHQTYQIAAASPNTAALVFGGGDLAADLGASLNWEPMFFARSLIVQAAAAHRLAVLDVPYLNLKDENDQGIIAETEKIKALGFTGKFAIHPKHIQPILKVFTPTPEEIAKAKRIVHAYDLAKGQACEVDGKMVDAPIYRSAVRILGNSKQ